MKHNLEKQLHKLGEKLHSDAAWMVAGKKEVLDAIQNIPPGGGDTQPADFPVWLNTQNLTLAALGALIVLGGILAYLYAQEAIPFEIFPDADQKAAVIESLEDDTEEDEAEPSIQTDDIPTPAVVNTNAVNQTTNPPTPSSDIDPVTVGDLLLLLAQLENEAVATTTTKEKKTLNRGGGRGGGDRY